MVIRGRVDPAAVTKVVDRSGSDPVPSAVDAQAEFRGRRDDVPRVDTSSRHTDWVERLRARV